MQFRLSLDKGLLWAQPGKDSKCTYVRGYVANWALCQSEFGTCPIRTHRAQYC